MPQQRQSLVPREHLYARLSRGVEGPVTLVRGPAGAGKTFLVASWVSSGRPRHPVAWLTLDAEADAPGVFWAYLLEALRGAAVVIDSDIGVPARAEEIDRLFLARLAAALSELPEPVVLVLDDFDRVSSQRVTAQLDYVVTYSAPQLRLVLVTRRHQPPGFHRHRVAGETHEIGPEDLAFTVGEARQLMRLHGLDLPTAAVEALASRSEGWVTGLRLSALAVQHGTAPERLLQEFAGRHGDIAEFMLAEVLEEQPPETQDLLLRTSILEQVHTDLADALTGRTDGERILEGLARASTFVRAIPGAEPWYRYHGLFAQALQGRLRSTAADLLPQLHRIASQWLADNGELAAAVTHA
ncbi:MAG TPA: AAA family ATPase, partial [Candidatus Eisenbacteria bacterium]|nr:AAA family ATPase [Candidatus Eisenbacteria bacterium]